MIGKNNGLLQIPLMTNVATMATPSKKGKYLCENLLSQRSAKSVNSYDLGREASLVSDFIEHQGDNPRLQRINLQDYLMPPEKFLEFMKFTSTCRYLTHINLSYNSLGLQAGHHLAQTIQSREENSQLQKLYLHKCSLAGKASLEVVQSLSRCKNLIDLDLGGNNLSEAGFHLAQSIKHWGNDPPLQKLNVFNCFIPADQSAELLKSLSPCKNLITLNLGQNNLSEGGHYLAECISAWGYDPPLQKLYLHNCSLQHDASKKVLQSLSTCRHLTLLSYGQNNLDDLGYNLADSIRSWGGDPSLQNLYLSKCSISEKASRELVQTLSSCKNLTDLALGGNNLREAGLHLAQSITFWGNDPPLQKLYLSNCCMKTDVCKELIKSLSTCKHLTTLDFGKNILGETGYNLAQSIRSWGNDPPLKQIYLHDCSLSVTASLELVKSLSTCRSLTELNLSGNVLDKAGHDLATSIKSWGDHSPLKKLSLHKCALSHNASVKLLQSLASCGNLTELDLGKNCLGEAGNDFAQTIRSWKYGPQLQELMLRDCNMPVTVWSALLQALSLCKQLISIDVSENNLGDAGKQLAQTIITWGEKSALKRLNLANCSIPEIVWDEIYQSLSQSKFSTVMYRNTYDQVEYPIATDQSIVQQSLQACYLSQQKGRDEVEEETAGIICDLVQQNHGAANAKSLFPPPLSSLAESICPKHGVNLKMERNQLLFEAQINKSNKEYLFARTFGNKVNITEPLSNFSVEVAEGVKTLIKHSFNTNFYLLRKVVPANECLASAVIQLHMTEKTEEGAEIIPKYKVIMPHYLPKCHNPSAVRVRFGNLKRPLLMEEIQKLKSAKRTFPCFEIDSKSITIYSNHFCDVVCTSTQKVCTSKVLAIPFGWIGTIAPEPQTHMKVKTYLCNYLYSNNKLKQKLEREASKFGLQILEQLTVPVDSNQDFEVDKSEVSVVLTVKGDWLPTNPDDRKWKKRLKKMIESNKLPGVFNISNGHLCKSEPFDAANFALTCETTKASFFGNIGVTLRIPEIPDQYRDIDIILPPPVYEVMKIGDATKVDGKSAVAGISTAGAKQLTDVRLLKLSNRITSRLKLRSLAIIGLGKSIPEVERHMQNTDISEAAYNVLCEWRNSQENKEVAFKNICKALKDDEVDLEFLIKQAFE